MTKPHVVVMGGGTGTFPVISGLKHEDVELASIITVSDSGGSAGKIRDEFGFQPVGDLRQALAALAESDGEEWIRKILLYRFQKGEGLQGHNLGNLILTALQDMTGDTTAALDIAEKVFRLEGQVIPVTKEVVQLEIEYEDGSKILGEHMLDQSYGPHQEKPKKIRQIALTPAAEISDDARAAIEKADFIIIGPGDYYASLLATLIPEGTIDAFRSTNAKIIYLVNLMTRLTQTDGMSATDHVRGIEKAIGRPVDFVIVNEQKIPENILQLYANEQEYPVGDDLDSDPRVVRAPLLLDQVVEKQKTDIAHRSLLRHDKEKLRKVLAEIIGNARAK